MKDYCTQNKGDCKTCDLAHGDRDCMYRLIRIVPKKERCDNCRWWGACPNSKPGGRCKNWTE